MVMLSVIDCGDAIWSIIMMLSVIDYDDAVCDRLLWCCLCSIMVMLSVIDYRVILIDYDVGLIDYGFIVYDRLWCWYV